MEQEQDSKMAQTHYALRWSNHAENIIKTFEVLFATETFVDVTLVCAETSIKAHKLILCACSPLFERIFSDNPCEHPVIYLKDFTSWELNMVLEFMYRGEVDVHHTQIPRLMRAAENLAVKGLVCQDPFATSKNSTRANRTPTPSTSPNDYDRNYCSAERYSATRTPGERSSPFSPVPSQNNLEQHQVKLPHMARLSFPETLLPRQECQSPVPRRKQARPRRRSGELCTAQDLSSTGQTKPESPIEETAENLCIKKQTREEKREMNEEKSRTPDQNTRSPEVDLNLQCGKEFRSSPVSVHPVMNLKQEIESHSPLPFPPMPSVSALAMTPPQSKFFGLDPISLFQTGLDGCRNPLYDIPDPRSAPDVQCFAKKKMGRPKGQHSAPRGGPPRSWTNAELTEALQQVWNKKMTTSQASRIFGIPYNSLLMYVRGKYGKSLKLEQLRKDCIGGPPMDLISMAGGNNNNNSCKTEREPEQIQPNTRPPSTEEQHPPAPMFNPFSHSFYPDFGTGFPIPVNMIHLLPQSEKSREHFAQQRHALEDDCKERVKDLDDEQDIFRPPALTVEDRRELVQQNGQD